MASAVHTLYHLSGLQVALRYPAYTLTPEIGVLGLDTAKTAQVLISSFLPFCDQ